GRGGNVLGGGGGVFLGDQFFQRLLEEGLRLYLIERREVALHEGIEVDQSRTAARAVVAEIVLHGLEFAQGDPVESPGGLVQEVTGGSAGLRGHGGEQLH